MKIALDIGHGKDNTYKGVPGLQEWEFNNDVMKRVARLLALTPVEVVWTQPPDSDTIKLSTRADIADDADADILISCHADYNPDSKARGHWVFYWGGSSNGKRLAQIWDKHADAILPNPDRGLYACRLSHWSNFYIVRKPKMPCILIEHAFMSNVFDLELLQSDDFRNKAAHVIYLTILEWFGLDEQDHTDYKKLYTVAQAKLEAMKKILEGN